MARRVQSVFGLTLHDDHILVRECDAASETATHSRSPKMLEEGGSNVFVAAAAECDEAELTRRFERDMRAFLYRLYSARPDSLPRSGLSKPCRLGRLMRDARPGSNDRLFS